MSKLRPYRDSEVHIENACRHVDLYMHVYTYIYIYSTYPCIYIYICVKVDN